MSCTHSSKPPFVAPCAEARSLISSAMKTIWVHPRSKEFFPFRVFSVFRDKKIHSEHPEKVEKSPQVLEPKRTTRSERTRNEPGIIPEQPGISRNSPETTRKKPEPIRKNPGIPALRLGHYDLQIIGSRGRCRRIRGGGRRV